MCVFECGWCKPKTNRAKARDPVIITSIRKGKKNTNDRVLYAAGRTIVARYPVVDAAYRVNSAPAGGSGSQRRPRLRAGALPL